MSFLCTTINKEVSYRQCINECQYFFKSACIDKMNEAYNQALKDVKTNILKGIKEDKDFANMQIKDANWEEYIKVFSR